jgi:hypothetical protein
MLLEYFRNIILFNEKKSLDIHPPEFLVFLLIVLTGYCFVYKRMPFVMFT